MPEGNPHQRLYAHPACFKQWLIASQRPLVDRRRESRRRAGALLTGLLATIISGVIGRPSSRW